ncbi:MAG: NAD(P)-dependent alcohol dehydrogenase [Myxococcota bacterium]
MRAARFARFGSPDVIEIRDVPRPKRRLPRDVLVQIEASSVNPKDVLLRKGKFGGVARPFLPLPMGSDFAGTIESAGSRSDLQPGDRVWGMLGGIRFGGCGEAVAARHDEVGLAPRSISLAEAASLPLVALTSLQALRDHGDMVPGSRVLIHGASGGVGTVAIQIAKAFGAHVTAVCSTRNHSLVTDLGADVSVDYHTTPPETLSERFDIFFDVFGDKPYDVAKAVLASKGAYVSTIPSARGFLDGFRTTLAAHRAGVILVRPSRSDLNTLARLVDEGQLRAVVDRHYPLADLADAHAYLETKRARGKVVIEVSPGAR